MAPHLQRCQGLAVNYAAQAIPQIDAEIAEKGHFWMETKYGNQSLSYGQQGSCLNVESR